MRALTGAAQEQHLRFLVHLLLHRRHEIGIGLHAGIGHPFDLDGTGHLADPVDLGTGTHIHQLRAGGTLQDLVSLLRGKCT
jgi:hypothetical protein